MCGLQSLGKQTDSSLPAEIFRDLVFVDRIGQICDPQIPRLANHVVCCTFFASERSGIINVELEDSVGATSARQTTTTNKNRT